MRRILLLALFLLCVTIGNAQTRLDDIGRITIHAVVPDYEELPYESRKLLLSKLSQMVTANGIADDESSVRFVLSAKINVVSKDIAAGPPQRISQKLAVTLMLGDIVEDKVYSLTDINTIGVGQSLEKTFISAFKNINPNNAKIKAFLLDGKQKILSFYETHCQDIIAEAQKQASTDNYEDALMMLSSIPDVCTSCFNDASSLASSVYTKMIEVRGGELLNEARALWAKNPTKEGAAEATRLLSQINFAAPCQKDVPALMAEITKKMNEIDRREWEHQMLVYQDGIDREKRQWEQSVREYNDNVQTQRMRLKAYRDVAVAYAENQPKVVTRVVNYNRILLW